MPTPNALPDALVRRFVDDVVGLIGADPTHRIAIAVSGGPDSLALLLLADAAFPGQIEAATVDHGLRPAGVREALFVSDLCAARGIPHAILTLDVLPQGNLSAKAREARYSALGDWCDARSSDWLMTAHHADDQLETMLMRLNRGSGVAGLSGVRARQGRIVRPLLHWRHDELVAVVNEAGIEAFDDPTNHDDTYDRARLRKKLRQADWLDAQAAAISADALADADAALEWWVDRLEAAHVRADDTGVTFDRADADVPAEILRRIVLRCIRKLDHSCKPRGVPLSKLIETLESGERASLGNVIASGGKTWHFRPAPPRRTTHSQ